MVWFRKKIDFIEEVKSNIYLFSRDYILNLYFNFFIGL